jgi:hypothetical protein
MGELTLIEDLFIEKVYLSLIFGFEDIRVQGIHSKGKVNGFIKFPEEVRLATKIKIGKKSVYQLNTSSLCQLIILVNNILVKEKYGREKVT